ncbi:MerR family DNA-binding transcriptional regulator [Micromonospora sp. DT31]|uniref:MerR family DNA-binding transcriptional regulator n=1 Tax=Micromonospora sp. DT31 TaxID=3393434 RepID=UPI003CF7395F
MDGQDLRSGQLADAVGVTVQTLRYYERRGLLAEPRRSPGGHRLYPAETVTLLRVVKAAQRPGGPGRPSPGSGSEPVSLRSDA